MAKKESKQGSHPPRIVNRKARHEYHILEVLECGLELVGTEVKSLRAGGMEINDAYARVRNSQLYLVNSSISQYSQASPLMQHEPLRDRRLLVHSSQIAKLQQHLQQKGRTLIPLAVYFKKGWAKCEIGIAVGKKQFDKRQDLKKRDQQRDIEREMGRRNRG